MNYSCKDTYISNITATTNIFTKQSLTTKCKWTSFLGVTLDSKMSFSSHIKYISVEATRILNFIKRNLCKCSQSTNIPMVRPILEYCSLLWDTHLVKDINELEKVQRGAAIWTVSDYNWSSSVTTMLETLQWPTLTTRRYNSRLNNFYKSIYHHTALKIPTYFTRTQRSTRQYHPFHFIIPIINCDYYKYSFYPRSIRDCNNLPIDIIESNSQSLF